MSWGSYRVMKCSKCSNIFEVEDDTLSIPKEKDTCPKCHAEGILMSEKTMLNVMQEQHEKFKKRKKRVIL